MRQAAQNAGRAIDEESIAASGNMLRSVVEEESSAYYTSGRILDDGIIDPRETRNVLGFTLSVIYTNEVKGLASSSSPVSKLTEISNNRSQSWWHLTNVKKQERQNE